MNDSSKKTASAAGAGTWFSQYSSTSIIYYISKNEYQTGGKQKITCSKAQRIVQTDTYTKIDELLGYVTSNSPDTYPEDGGQDGYWYKKIN